MLLAGLMPHLRRPHCACKLVKDTKRWPQNNLEFILLQLVEDFGVLVSVKKSVMVINYFLKN